MGNCTPVQTIVEVFRLLVMKGKNQEGSVNCTTVNVIKLYINQSWMSDGVPINSSSYCLVSRVTTPKSFEVGDWQPEVSELLLQMSNAVDCF